MSRIRRLITLDRRTGLVIDPIQIGDAGLAHLKALKQLHPLTVTQSDVTPNGVAALQRALPECKFVTE